MNMLEEKINGTKGSQSNLKNNIKLYSALLAFGTIVGCNSFGYQQPTKQTTLTCSANQSLYCSKPQGSFQNDCKCYDNMSPTGDDPYARIW